MTLDNGGPFDQLLEKWKALDAGVPLEKRRETAVTFMMQQLDSKSRFMRAILEAAYDRLFPPPPALVKQSVCLDGGKCHGSGIPLRCQWCDRLMSS